MKTLAWIILLALVIFGIYWVVNQNDNGNVINNNTSENNSENNGQSTTTINENSTSTSTIVAVSYTSSGFNPRTVTINQGDTVRFVNQGTGNMWVGSDEHPIHAEYDNTNMQSHCVAGAAPSFDSCKNLGNGESYSFTFNKVGTWGYHNHSLATHGGSVIVK